MGREIKFRAKRLDRDEWLYGNLVRIDDDYRIIEQEAHNNMVVDCQIVPETAGQFTGLRDKNGVEIYEGDLLSLDSWEGIHQISFIDGAFCLAFYKGDYHGEYSGDISYIHHAEREQAKIIGNIHEGIKQ